MLSAFQNRIIDALPDEGAFHFLKKGEKIPYDRDVANELAMLPLHGKKAGPSKRVIILHGAPGSGKTHSGFIKLAEELGGDPRNAEDWAIISYDEHGAIFDIPEYREAISGISLQPNDIGIPGMNRETWDKRYQAWLDFQPLSQYIRSQTLKQALKEELSLYIDTTSSSAGVLKLIDTLRDLDYTDIEVWSYQGRLREATMRIEDRMRPTSMDDLLKKRVGAMEMLPQIVRYADRVELFENSSNVLDPAHIARFEVGSLIGGNPRILGSSLAMIDDDTSLFRDMAVKQYGTLEGENLAMRYNRAKEVLYVTAMPILDSFLARAQAHYDNQYD